MENSIIVALSRQMSLRRELSVIAQNMANLNTSGYMGEKMMFVEHLARSQEDDSQFGEKVSYVRDVAQVLDTSEGGLTQTGNTLDLAIRGEGFFQVQTPDGDVLYTRNGRFELDLDGQLVNGQGNVVLSDAGAPLIVAPEETSLTIAADGTFSTENGVLGKLGIYTFDKIQNLQKQGASSYAAGDEIEQPVANPHVLQGYREESNVNAIMEMTRMIEVQRAYAKASEFLKKEDERIRKVFAIVQ